MEFYKLSNPTTEQIFNAIISNEYTPLESIKPKAKQIEVLLKDYWNCSEVLVTFEGVSNTGGVPIFFSNNTDLYEIATEQDGFYDLSEEEQEHQIELLGSYARTFADIFFN
jgi:hypothetical protein